MFSAILVEAKVFGTTGGALVTSTSFTLANDFSAHVSTFPIKNSFSVTSSEAAGVPPLAAQAHLCCAGLFRAPLGYSYKAKFGGIRECLSHSHQFIEIAS